MFGGVLPPPFLLQMWKKQSGSSMKLVYVQGARKQDLQGEFQGAKFVESAKEETKEQLRLFPRPKEPR